MAQSTLSNVSVFSLIFRNKVASVRILEEIDPPDFLDEIRLKSRDRWKTFGSEISDEPTFVKHQPKEK
jgi:hypothetical protein